VERLPAAIDPLFASPRRAERRPARIGSRASRVFSTTAHGTARSEAPRGNGDGPGLRVSDLFLPEQFRWPPRARRARLRAARDAIAACSSRPRDRGPSSRAEQLIVSESIRDVPSAGTCDWKPTEIPSPTRRRRVAHGQPRGQCPRFACHLRPLVRAEKRSSPTPDPVAQPSSGRRCGSPRKKRSFCCAACPVLSLYGSAFLCLSQPATNQRRPLGRTGPETFVRFVIDPPSDRRATQLGVTECNL